MADESQWCCPICYSNQEGIASLSPCRHQFCLGCALRWTQLKKSCPLCRAETTSIMFSERSDNDFLTFSVSDPTEPWAEDEEDEQVAAEPVARPLVAGFPPEVWADFFRSDPFHFRPLLLWVRRELGAIFRGAWWTMHVVEVAVVGCLCSYGLDEELLLEDLSARNYLRGNTETFVRQLIETASEVCGRELQQHLAQQNPAARPSSTNSSDTTPSSTSSSDRSPSSTTSPASGHSPTASSDTSSSPTASHSRTPESILAFFSSLAGSHVEEQPSTSEPAPCSGLSHPQSVPIPAEQEQLQEEPEVAVAGPSGQGGSCSPSPPSWVREHSPGGSQHPPKRRALQPQDSPQPHKRPCHHQP
ncbi:E3 ubiquitin-protein ligase Topors-like [Heliangelus exortis]|uniref:E3 ubiquitin-protein ligase Topors-like n=1 Tax=Heliangelus exortis TaxID=472823 RepID=UPI003A903733